MESIDQLKKRYEDFKALNLSLNMQRGQPADANFDLVNPMLNILTEDDYISSTGLDLRNYPGGPAGLKEARELFASMLNVDWEEVIVGNNASLKMLSNLLMWTTFKGVNNSASPWNPAETKFIVATPGYDRHFLLLETLGFSMETVDMTSNGPDMDQVEKLAADPSVKGMLFVPTYSNPTGDCLSEENARRLVSMKCAAPDFTIFADDAYVVHHIVEETSAEQPNLLRLSEEAGNPDRVYLFASTSKVTFAGAGIGAMASSKANLEWYLPLIGTQSIGPNKIEQYRHVKFLTEYPGGYEGLMKAHAAILSPKFDAVYRILEKELGGTGLATWTEPHGGYFVSLDTAKPVADKVVKLAAEAGVSLTPAGATFPGKKDPNNRNIRLAPTRPPLAEVEKAMEVVALCVKLASI